MFSKIYDYIYVAFASSFSWSSGEANYVAIKMIISLNFSLFAY